MSKAKKRMIIDVLMTALLVFEMFYQLTGNALHEYVGFAFFTCIIVHLILSRKWISSTVSSLGTTELNGRRKVLAFIAFLLAVDIVLLGVSSVVISNTFWTMGLDFSAFNPGDIWVPIHTATSYALCIIVAAHLASHWTFLAKNMHIEYNPARRQAIGQAVNVAVGVGALALGVTGYSQVTQAIADEQSAQGETQAIADEQPAQGETQTTYSEHSKHARGSKKAKYMANTEQNAVQPGRQNTEDSTAGQAYGERLGAQSYGETYSSGNSSDGICTLCRKQCSFSNLRCDKPYREGLL